MLLNYQTKSNLLEEACKTDIKQIQCEKSRKDTARLGVSPRLPSEQVLKRERNQVSGMESFPAGIPHPLQMLHGNHS